MKEMIRHEILILFGNYIKLILEIYNFGGFSIGAPRDMLVARVKPFPWF